MLSKFLDKLGTIGKKPEAFPVGVWRSNKGKVFTHSSPHKTLEQLCEHGEKTQVISQEFF